MASCLYVGPLLDGIRIVSHEGLEATTERHRLEIPQAPLTPCLAPLAELSRLPELAGTIVEIHQGWPSRWHLQHAARVLKTGKRAWFYWPEEQAIEWATTLTDQKRFLGVG